MRQGRLLTLLVKTKVSAYTLYSLPLSLSPFAFLAHTSK